MVRGVGFEPTKAFATGDLTTLVELRMSSVLPLRPESHPVEYYWVLGTPASKIARAILEL